MEDEGGGDSIGEIFWCLGLDAKLDMMKIMIFSFQQGIAVYGNSRKRLYCND